MNRSARITIASGVLVLSLQACVIDEQIAESPTIVEAEVEPSVFNYPRLYTEVSAQCPGSQMAYVTASNTYPINAIICKHELEAGKFERRSFVRVTIPKYKSGSSDHRIALSCLKSGNVATGYSAHWAARENRPIPENLTRPEDALYVAHGNTDVVWNYHMTKDVRFRYRTGNQQRLVQVKAKGGYPVPKGVDEIVSATYLPKGYTNSDCS